MQDFGITLLYPHTTIHLTIYDNGIKIIVRDGWAKYNRIMLRFLSLQASTCDALP